ncbi:MAG: VWA domain-containing protein [Planctomycetes bacterium]|nr:VWA domain-containing protein [Planctomycetota bacterium]
MLLALTLHAVLTLPAHHPAEPPALAPPPGDRRAIQVIGSWLQQYHKGRYDLTRKRVDTNASLIQRHKLIPSDFVGTLDYRAEIDLLCRQARELESDEAARAILGVAAVGLDPRIRYSATMQPDTVRSVGEKHLAAFQSGTVRAFLIAVARGTTKSKPALQAAALRYLGSKKLREERPGIAAQIGAEKRIVRLATATALGRLLDSGAIPALAERLLVEGDPAVVVEMLWAIRSIHSASGKSGVSPRSLDAAVVGAVQALGRTDSWRADLAVLDFLETFRSRHAIPRLIWMLERFDKEPQLLRTGRLTTRVRVHEVLTNLTGARIPMDQPARWRKFWTDAAEKFVLPAEPASVAASGSGGTGSAFFNIPVQGKRVVFVIDCSGSMSQPMPLRSGGTSGGGKGATDTKLAVLKRELWKAISALPKEVQFNVIYYSNEAAKWDKQLVAASKPNKARLRTWLDGVRARGGTNIYDALRDALGIRSLVYGDRYDSNVEEVFLLSDGAPSVGEIRDPNRIVEVITESNKFSRVRINTIYLGAAAPGRPGRPGRARPAPRPGRRLSGIEMMKQLAAKNGGKFVQP